MKTLFRYQLGLTMAYQTCHPLQDMQTQGFNYISQKFEDTEMVGLYPPYGSPFRRNMQKFYEQSIGLMEIDLTSGTQDFLVTILVTEAYSATLDQPLKEIYPEISTNNYLDVIIGLANIGDSLYGKKILHGDISLSSIGVDAVTVNGNDSPYTTLKPVLRLSDTMSNLNRNNKSKANYVDDMLRYAPEYRAPWIESNIMKDSDGTTNLYTYSWDLREDGFALVQVLQKFVALNGIGKNLKVIQLMNAFKKEYQRPMDQPANVPNGDQFSMTIIYALKASGYIQTRLLI